MLRFVQVFGLVQGEAQPLVKFSVRQFGCMQCQRCKESSSRAKRKRRVFLCGRTVGVKVEGKVIPASFLKIERRGTLVGAKDRGERGADRRIGW